MNDNDASATVLQLTVVLVPPDFLSATKPIAGVTTRKAWEQNIARHIQGLLMEGEVWLPSGTQVIFT